MDTQLIEHHFEYTKYACMITAIALVVIVVFIISPLAVSPFMLRFIKLIIVFTLLVSIGILYQSIEPMYHVKGLFDDVAMGDIKNNFFVTMVYIAFIIILGVVVIRH